LVRVDSRRLASGKYSFTLPDFIDYRDQNQSLSGIAAYTPWSANLTDQGEPEQFQGLRISANAFELLGVEAVAGRVLAPGDGGAGQRHVAGVRCEGLGRRRSGADPQLGGKKLTLNGASYTVVGVLPPQFFFPIPIREAELAVPLAPDAHPLRGLRASTNFLRALGRLTPEFH